MREYKFRAWHKDAKEMVHEDEPGKALKWRNEGQNVIVMQYTGLKDRNGVEIYEGDLVRPCYNRFKAMEVKFTNGRYNIVDYDLKRCQVEGNIYETKEE